MPRLLLLLLALFSGLATAAGAAPDADPDLERAARLRDEAKLLRTQADDTLAARLPACYKRFLVNRCITNEKETRLETIRQAREMEIEASRIELAQKRRAAGERSTTDAPTQPAAPAESSTIQPEPAADATRRQREADAARATSAQQDEQRQKDAAKASARAKAEAEAAERAAAAERDRARYEERIRKREAEKAKETAN